MKRRSSWRRSAARFSSTPRSSCKAASCSRCRRIFRDRVYQHGIRNVTLLTQAPTGTTGTMVNTSTGIEPFFSWIYYRKSRSVCTRKKCRLCRSGTTPTPARPIRPTISSRRWNSRRKITSACRRRSSAGSI
ncbi:MAG: hypothetical protein U0703_10965 [Anaerolineae bacterium]